MSKLLTAIAFVFATALGVVSQCYSNDALKGEFLKEAPRAWEKYLAQLRNIELTTTESGNIRFEGEEPHLYGDVLSAC